MDLNKIKINPKLEIVKKNYNLILISILILQINSIVIAFLTKKSSFIINTIFIIAFLFTFVLLKDLVDINLKNKSIKYFKLSIPLYFVSISNTFFCFAIKKLEGNELVNGVYMFMLFFTFSIFLLAIALYQRDEVKNYLNIFFENSPYTEVESNEIKYGDAVIGYKVDEKGITTDIPIILPFKDRFVHLLCLGPTGSGKTSQIIIPMIDRDLQYDGLGIIVIEPKGDLAEKIFQLGKHYEKNVLYFNPTLYDCPYFNPLFGDEDDVIENMATTFKTFSVGSSQFFLDQNEMLLRRALKVIKRLKGNDANFLDLDDLLNDTNGKGKTMIISFKKLRIQNDIIARENEEIASYFLNNYYLGMGGGQGTPKTFEHTSGIRTQVSKLIANKYLRRVLNPPPGKGSEIDFDKAMSEGNVLCIGTAQGKLRDLGKFLGYFIILQLQSAVFRRPGTEDTRRPCILYIDEFQEYTNPSFGIMLTQGRSYKISCNLATQARDQITMGGGNDGKAFLSLVSANARNVIVFPGVSGEDSQYYSKEFGTQLNIIKKQTRAYDSVLGMKAGFGNRVSESIDEEEIEVMSPTQIRYRDFGYITYSLIKNSTLQVPGVSQIQYIDYELNKLLDKEVEAYRVEQEEKLENLEKLENNSNLPLEKPQQNIILKNNSIEDDEDSPDIFDIDIPIDDTDIYFDLNDNETAKDRNDNVISNDNYSTGSSNEVLDGDVEDDDFY